MLRTPLRSIDPNGRRGIELSPYQRGLIIGRYQENATPARIAKDLQIADSTVRDSIANDPQQEQGKSLSRSGRPSKLSLRDTKPAAAKLFLIISSLKTSIRACG